MILNTQKYKEGEVMIQISMTNSKYLGKLKGWIKSIEWLKKERVIFNSCIASKLELSILLFLYPWEEVFFFNNFFHHFHSTKNTMLKCLLLLSLFVCVAIGGPCDKISVDVKGSKKSFSLSDIAEWVFYWLAFLYLFLIVNKENMACYYFSSLLPFCLLQEHRLWLHIHRNNFWKMSWPWQLRIM